MSLSILRWRFAATGLIALLGFAIDRDCVAQDSKQSGMLYAFAKMSDEGGKLQVEVQRTMNQVYDDTAKTRQEAYEVSVPVTKVVEQTYTVKIPYTELVTKDGTPTRVTKTREETRTRKVPVTTIVKQRRFRTVVVPRDESSDDRPTNEPKGTNDDGDGDGVFMTVSVGPNEIECSTLDGDLVPWTDAQNRFTKRQPVLLLNGDTQLDQRLRPFFRDDLMVIRQTSKP